MRLFQNALSVLLVMIALDSKASDALVDAIEDGKSLREIQGLALNIDVNKPDKDGHLPLVEAASHRSPSVVRFLIVRGADVNLADQHGVKPLQALTTTLAHERRFETIEVLCQHRVSLDGINLGSLGPAIRRVNAKYIAPVPPECRKNNLIEEDNVEGILVPDAEDNDSAHYDPLPSIIDISSSDQETECKQVFESSVDIDSNPGDGLVSPPLSKNTFKHRSAEEAQHYQRKSRCIYGS